MTQKEQTRLQVLNSVLADQVPVCQAAEVLGVSERHMRRILAAYRKEGAAALAHGNRGRRPANTTTGTKMTYVVQLARTRYAGTNHTHLTELLTEREGIDLSRSTVAPHPGQRRHEQPPPPPAAQTPCSAQTHGPRRDAAADRWEPPSVAGGTRTPVRPAVGRGRCHRHGA